MIRKLFLLIACWGSFFFSTGQCIPPEQVCRFYTDQTELRQDIPHYLLTAISLTESGRTVSGKFIAWPWTLNVKGVSYFYPSKIAAIRAVQTFQAQGIRSIDVGCMQINLKQHPQAFRNLYQALDPYENIKYGAQFLKGLKASGSRSWLEATAHYHSATRRLQGAYRSRVLKNWHKTRQTALLSPKEAIYKSKPYTPSPRLRAAVFVPPLRRITPAMARPTAPPAPLPAIRRVVASPYIIRKAVRPMPTYRPR